MIGCRLNQSIGLVRGNNELRQREMIALINVEMILSL
jgi:hypothetical protein